MISNDKKLEHIIFIIDYGMSKKYVDKANNHIPFCINKDFLGTAKFASVYTHMGIEQSRRDDLESIGYIIVYLYCNNLPWMNLNIENKSKRYAEIKNMKKNLKFEEFCYGLPKEYIDYMTYVRNLQFNECPDYDYLISLIEKAAKNNNISLDYKYDWIKEKINHSNSMIEKDNTLLYDFKKENGTFNTENTSEKPKIKISFGNNKYLSKG